MAGDPVAKGFSFATLVATAAAALALMGTVAFEVRPLAELDALTITALLFGFFNALGVLIWSGSHRAHAEEAGENVRVETAPSIADRRLTLAPPVRQEAARSLPFPDRRKPGLTDRRRLHGGGRRSSDAGFPVLVSSSPTAEVIRIRGANLAPHT